MSLVDLLSRYKNLVLEFGYEKIYAEDPDSYRADNLQDKLLWDFGDSIMI